MDLQAIAETVAKAVDARDWTALDRLIGDLIPHLDAIASSREPESARKLIGALSRALELGGLDADRSRGAVEPVAAQSADPDVSACAAALLENLDGPKQSPPLPVDEARLAIDWDVLYSRLADPTVGLPHEATLRKLLIALRDHREFERLGRLADRLITRGQTWPFLWTLYA